MAVEDVAEYLGAQKPLALEQELQQRREMIDGLERSIVNHTEQATRDRMVAREQQALVDAAIATMDCGDWSEHLVAEFRQVAEHPRIEDCFLDEQNFYDPVSEKSVFLVTTPDLRISRSDTGESRWLGQFKIELNVKRGVIRLTNLTTRRGGRDHPHVTDGMPCFGGHLSSFMQLMSNGDLFVLVELLIQYIETLNLEDEYGRYGSYWFGVTDADLGAPEDQCLDGSWTAEAVPA